MEIDCKNEVFLKNNYLQEVVHSVSDLVLFTRRPRMSELCLSCGEGLGHLLFVLRAQTY